MLDQALIAVLARTGRVELVRTLKAFPDRDFTINELARVARVPTMTTWRAVDELKKLRVVRVRKVGNARAVRITDDKEQLKRLRLVEDIDPQKSAAKEYSSRMAEFEWAVECRLFGSIGRGEHLPGEEVDVAIVYDQRLVGEDDAKAAAAEVARSVHEGTNVLVVPLCVSEKDMGRKGGLAAELRDKETIWSRRKGERRRHDIGSARSDA